VSAPVRVVVAEDDVLMRQGVVHVLRDAGFDVVAEVGDAEALLRRGLGQFYEEDYIVELMAEHPGGVGYLLKERVGDVEVFTDAVARVAAGGTALDPEVVGRLLGRRRQSGPMDRLSAREREVLAAMAEGKSNHGIAEALVITEATVEKHVRFIFQKLDLGQTPTEHRRVLAVLTYLRGSAN
jgi:DNA-binding NarL/FixJ family response regulator